MRGSENCNKNSNKNEKMIEFLEGKLSLNDFLKRREINATDNPNINSNIVIEETTIYEIDENCMNQARGSYCTKKNQILWNMECVLDIECCDVGLVDDL